MECFYNLLRQPLRCRMSGDCKPEQLSSAVAHDQKRKQALEWHGWNHAELDRRDRVRMVSQERRARGRTVMMKGAALWVGGQRYVYVADFEHVTQEGRDVSIKVWESTCATCGQLFRTNATITQAALRRLNRRCLNCLAAGVAVTRRRAPKQSATPEDIALLRILADKPTASRDDLIPALHWRTTNPQRKVADTLRRFLNGGLIVRKHNGFELTHQGKRTIAAGEETANRCLRRSWARRVGALP
jgi:hypothetical protein